jgi:hypothetical protein
MPSRAGRRKRRRRPRPRAVLLLVVLLALVAGGGYAYLTVVRDDDADEGTAAPPVVCPTAAPAPAPAVPAPAAVTIRLLNGTERDGLAASVAADLTLRGFVVGATGNAPARNPGPSRVSAAVDGRPAALLVAAQVPDAEVAADPAVPAGTVDLVLGDAFTGLRTPEQATAALAAATATTTPPPGC